MDPHQVNHKHVLCLHVHNHTPRTDGPDFIYLFYLLLLSNPEHTVRNKISNPLQIPLEEMDSVSKEEGNVSDISLGE